MSDWDIVGDMYCWLLFVLMIFGQLSWLQLLFCSGEFLRGLWRFFIRMKLISVSVGRIYMVHIKKFCIITELD